MFKLKELSDSIIKLSSAVNRLAKDREVESHKDDERFGWNLRGSNWYPNTSVYGTIDKYFPKASDAKKKEVVQDVYDLIIGRSAWLEDQ